MYDKASEKIFKQTWISNFFPRDQRYQPKDGVKNVSGTAWPKDGVKLLSSFVVYCEMKNM